MNNISPIDGRYETKTNELQNYFSEKTLFSYRINIELKYFYKIINTIFDIDSSKFLNTYVFTDNDYKTIKNIEKTVNHDVKAVEYFLKQKLKLYPDLLKYKEFIHFGLTSEDINSCSYMCMIKNCIEDIINPLIVTIINTLKSISMNFDFIMTSYTHGQPASVTTLNKEFKVFIYRLEKIMNIKNNYSSKMGGSSGNLTVHKVCYPDINWEDFFNNFMDSELNLKRNLYTTQIDNYDDLSAIFFKYLSINNVLIDLVQDIWLYISKNFIKLKCINNEVGSSAMPQKINPINFENAEANLMLANNLFYFFIDKITKSRLQRDLTGSSIYRNFGLAFSYCLISYKSLLEGLSRIDINKSVIKEDFNHNIIILSEIIAGLLKKRGLDGYEILKDFTRGKSINKSILKEFILDNLNENDSNFLLNTYF